MALAQHEKQKGSFLEAHNSAGTPKRSRSPSPIDASWNHLHEAKMPKHKLVKRQTKVLMSSVSEDEEDFAFLRQVQTSSSQEDNDVFQTLQKPETVQKKGSGNNNHNGGKDIDEVDAKIVKKKLANLFKSGKSGAFKRQDSDLGYHSQTSPMSPLTNQHGFNGTVNDGLSNGALLRDLSIEEELEHRLREMSEAAQKWKTRSKQLQKQFNSCERECYQILENLQEQYKKHISDLEAKLGKSEEQHKQLHVQKSQTETELRKVMTAANKESTKFKQELENVQKEVSNLSESMKRLKETNKKLEKELEEVNSENDRLKREIEDRAKESLSEKSKAKEMQSKIKTSEMQTDMYKSLLDIALSKMKLLEESPSGNSSLGNGARRLVPATRGRYALRVSAHNPTDMCVEDVEQENDWPNLDRDSVSSENTQDDHGSSKRTSVCSSVNVSDIMGYENGSLPSPGGSSVRDEEALCDVDGAVTDSQCLLRRRTTSESAMGNQLQLPTSKSRTSTLSSPDTIESYNVNTSERQTSVGELVQSSAESLAGVRKAIQTPRNRRSLESMPIQPYRLQRTLSVELDVPEVQPREHVRSRTTPKEIKRMRSDSVKANAPSTSESNLQRLHKYRSVGDIILRGISRERRKSSKEEKVTRVSTTDLLDGANKKEDQNNNSNQQSHHAPQFHRRRLSAGSEAAPSIEKKRPLSRESSDVSTSSHDLRLAHSSSTDNVAGTRTSGFVALRTRRNGFMANPGDFKDISKQLRKKQKSSNFSDIIKRLSREGSDDKKDEEYKPSKRRTRKETK